MGMYLHTRIDYGCVCQHFGKFNLQLHVTRKEFEQRAISCISVESLVPFVKYTKQSVKLVSFNKESLLQVA